MADVKNCVDFLQGTQTPAASETESSPSEVRSLEKLIAVTEKSLLFPPESFMRKLQNSSGPHLIYALTQGSISHRDCPWW